MEIVIHNFDRLPIRVHGITCKSESISWDMTIYAYLGGLDVGTCVTCQI